MMWSSIYEGLRKALDFIYSDTTIFAIVGVGLLLIAWFWMSIALNLDDMVWKGLTFLGGVFLLFSALMMLERGTITVDSFNFDLSFVDNIFKGIGGVV